MRLRSSKIVGEEEVLDAPTKDLPKKKAPVNNPENEVPVEVPVRPYPQEFIKCLFDTKNAIWHHPQMVWKQHVMRSKDIGRFLLGVKINGIVKGTLYLRKGSTLPGLPNVQDLSGSFETFLLKPEPVTAWWTYPGLKCELINQSDVTTDGRLVVAYAKVEGYWAKFFATEAPDVSPDEELFETSIPEDIGETPRDVDENHEDGDGDGNGIGDDKTDDGPGDENGPADDKIDDGPGDGHVPFDNDIHVEPSNAGVDGTFPGYSVTPCRRDANDSNDHLIRILFPTTPSQGVSKPSGTDSQNIGSKNSLKPEMNADQSGILPQIPKRHNADTLENSEMPDKRRRTTTFSELLRITTPFEFVKSSLTLPASTSENPQNPPGTGSRKTKKKNRSREANKSMKKQLHREEISRSPLSAKTPPSTNGIDESRVSLLVSKSKTPQNLPTTGSKRTKSLNSSRGAKKWRERQSNWQRMSGTSLSSETSGTNGIGNSAVSPPASTSKHPYERKGNSNRRRSAKEEEEKLLDRSSLSPTADRSEIDNRPVAETSEEYLNLTKISSPLRPTGWLNPIGDTVTTWNCLVALGRNLDFARRKDCLFGHISPKLRKIHKMP